jgi:hypothetical protein
VILPPYSILLWKAEQERNPERLRQRLEFSAQIIAKFIALPHVRVFDFRDAVEMTHDLDRFKDMSHFNASVSADIARAIAAGRHKVDPADPLASIRRLERQIADFRPSARPPQALGN